MDRETIIETIQRLLALSGSPNEHEAKLALARAQEWMIRHNVSMAEVDSTEIDRGQWVDEDVAEGRPYEQKFVASICTKFFFVKCYECIKFTNSRRVTHLCIFGDRENVAVAKHVYVYLTRRFRELWDDYRRLYGAERRHAQGYYFGLHEGFTRKLREERKVQEREADTSHALVVVQSKLDRKFQENHPYMQKSRPARISDGSAFYDGVDHGRQISLHQPVGDSRDVRAIGRE